MKRLLYIFISIVILTSYSPPKSEEVFFHPEMVSVTGGTFTMGYSKGDDTEKPEHKVTVKTFQISRYEVTNAQFAAFLNDKKVSRAQTTDWFDIDNPKSNISYQKDKYKVAVGYENYPVAFVSWHGAVEYCQWLGGRLPTEAEWEYAARGGIICANYNAAAQYKYSGSNDLNAVSWNIGNSGFMVHPVGQKLPNDLGLYDMTGNVSEWCSDWFDAEYYANSPAQNPQGADEGEARVVRGGSWTNETSYMRVSFRGLSVPDEKSSFIGFRVVKEVK